MTTTRALMVWLLLLLLLTATVGASFAGLGNAALAVNLAIATAKAGLILWFYMELSQAQPLTRLFAFGAFAWLSLLFGLGFSDWLTR